MWRRPWPVLSRYPITRAELVTFEPYSKAEALLAGNHDSVLAYITLSGERTIAVWAVHLEVRSKATRIRAAQKIRELSSRLDVPVFVAGDLNSVYPLDQGGDETTTAISLLLGSGRFEAFPDVTNLAAYPTFPSGRPARVIDWILHPPGWSLVTGVVATDTLSDHLLVTASLSPPKPHDEPFSPFGSL